MRPDGRYMLCHYFCLSQTIGGFAPYSLFVCLLKGIKYCSQMVLECHRHPPKVPFNRIPCATKLPRGGNTCDHFTAEVRNCFWLRMSNGPVNSLRAERDDGLYFMLRSRLAFCMVRAFPVSVHSCRPSSRFPQDSRRDPTGQRPLPEYFAASCGFWRNCRVRKTWRT
jgi:hypothetical protein